MTESWRDGTPIILWEIGANKRRQTEALACWIGVSYALSMERLTQDELSRLTPPERLDMIAQLWDSLEENQLPVSAAQKDELDRRLDRLDADRRESVTWDALKAELERRCP